MDLFGIDWSEGWAGNLTAEIVGIVGGVLITYLVVERVVRWRISRDRKPARKRLIDKLRRTILLINSRWAAALEMEGAYDVNRSSAELEEEVRSRLKERLGFDKGNQTLDDLVAANLAGSASFASQRLRRLAVGIGQELQEMSLTVDRYANILEDDTELQTLVGDLEDRAPNVKRSLGSLEAFEAMDMEEQGKADVVTMCLLTFDTSSKLRKYLDS